MDAIAFQNAVSLGQLIIGAVGFYLLYRTLKLQAYTFEEQRKVTELDNKKFLYQMRPVFQVKEGKSYNSSDSWLWYLVLTQNVALDFYMILRSKEIHLYPLIDYKADKINVDEKVVIYNSVVWGDDTKVEILLEIYFTDEIGTRYMQVLKGLPEKVHIMPPVQLDGSPKK